MKVTIQQAMYESSPRTEFDNLGTVVLRCDRHNFGDKNYNKNYSENEIKQRLNLKDKDCIILDIYIYEHSGVTINTTGFNCPWDSGIVGFIYVTKEKVRDYLGVKRVNRKKVEQILKQEIKTLDQYLTGNVWSFMVEDEQGNILDSCSGFYGNTLEETGMCQPNDERFELFKQAWEERFSY